MNSARLTFLKTGWGQGDSALYSREQRTGCIGERIRRKARDHRDPCDNKSGWNGQMLIDVRT
jgi:hypothetical protein